MFLIKFHATLKTFEKHRKRINASPLQLAILIKVRAPGNPVELILTLLSIGDGDAAGNTETAQEEGNGRERGARSFPGVVIQILVMET